MSATEYTNGDLMKVLLDIKGEQGEIKGTVATLASGFGDEKLRTRASELAIEERLRKVEGSRERIQGERDHRNLLGHVATGILSAGAAITAMWSGVFHSPH